MQMNVRHKTIRSKTETNKRPYVWALRLHT